MAFPIHLKDFRGIPINSHPGAFGVARKHNFHEGVDLYVPVEGGAEVLAIADGEVILNCAFTGPEIGMPWWKHTEALLVKSAGCYYVYGEIHSTLKPGDLVTAGSVIAKVVPVLPIDKLRADIPGHSVSMLHLEKYNLEDFLPEKDFWSSWEQWDTRPVYLEDPTPDLIDILKKEDRLTFLHY